MNTLSGINWRAHIVGVQLALRVAVAGGLSIAIAQFLGLDTPIFAFIAAAIVTDLDPAYSRDLGLRRIVATVVGAAFGAMLSYIMSPSPWAIALGIAVTMLACQFVRAQDGAKVAAFTCGIIMLVPGQEPWVHASFRLVETLLGVAVAWAISYVPKLIRIEEPSTK